jgi:hypothetical protein
MTTTQDTYPIGQRGVTAGRKGTIIGHTQLHTQIYGGSIPALIVRFDDNQGGWLTGPGLHNDATSKDTPFAAYVSAFVTVPDAWEAETLSQLKQELNEAALAIADGKRIRGTVASLSDEAYEVATRVSEELCSVGLTGLIEDTFEPDVTGHGREDVFIVLANAASRAA